MLTSILCVRMRLTCCGKLTRLQDTASGLYTQWKGLALASDQHLVAIYGFTNLWTLGYNLFADVWLSTSVVESSVSIC
jgi:hypothetical protein